MWSRYTDFHAVESNGAAAAVFPFAGVLRRFFILPLLTPTFIPSGAVMRKLWKSLPSCAASNGTPRFLSSASTFLVSHGSMPKVIESQTAVRGGLISAEHPGGSAGGLAPPPPPPP